MIPSPLPRNLKTQRNGFSLVEVCLALGVVSFSLLALLALVPNGLQALQSAATETSLAAIRNAVRSEMNTANIADLAGGTPARSYYDRSGRRLPASAPEGDRFFQLDLVLSDPDVTGQAGGFTSSAKRVALHIAYPAFAPDSSRTTNSFALFLARQTSQ